MAKRKRKKSNNNKILIYTAWTLAVIALVLSSVVAGYYYGYKDAKSDYSKKIKHDEQKRISILKKLENTTSKPHTSVNKRLKEVLKKASKIDISSKHKYEDLADLKSTELVKRARKEHRIISKKPKLAIIIDDVSVRSQVEAIKSLGIPITMSFLPPSKFRPNSAKLASHEKFYMVHLPMEAKNFSAEEPQTLRVSDSDKKIFDRIKYIKKIFPKVSYINNHTGSKFTSNELAMNRLLYALNSKHIHFIDSRTTAQTKAPKVMKNLGLKYVARDVFLDNELDKTSIKKAIKKAIKIAKLHGTAIAIGHPHANTILAIYESKKLLKEVDLVYINRLY